MKKVDSIISDTNPRTLAELPDIDCPTNLLHSPDTTMLGQLPLYPPHPTKEQENEYKQHIGQIQHIADKLSCKFKKKDVFLSLPGVLVSRQLRQIVMPNYFLIPRIDVVRISLDQATYKSDEDMILPLYMNCEYVDKKVYVKDISNKYVEKWRYAYTYHMAIKADSKLNKVYLACRRPDQHYNPSLNLFYYKKRYIWPTLKLYQPGPELINIVHNAYSNYKVSMVEFSYDLITPEPDKMMEYLRAHLRLPHAGKHRLSKQFDSDWETVYIGDPRNTKGRAVRVYPKNYGGGASAVRLELVMKNRPLAANNIFVLTDLLDCQPAHMASCFKFVTIDHSAIWKQLLGNGAGDGLKTYASITKVLDFMMGLSHIQKDKQLHEAMEIIKALPKRNGGYLTLLPEYDDFLFNAAQINSFFTMSEVNHPMRTPKKKKKKTLIIPDTSSD